MKKIFIIDDNFKNSFIQRAAKKITNAQEKTFIGGKEAEEFINKETPDFLLLNLQRPVNGDGVMRTLGSLDGNNRLRVTIYNLDNIKAFILNLLPFEFIDSLVENLFNKFSKRFPQHHIN